ASSVVVRRRLNGKRLVSRLDPSPAQNAEAAAIHERLQRWHGITRSLLHRHALTPFVDLEQKVRTATAYVLLQRQTDANITEGLWREAFDRELTHIAIQLEQILDMCVEAIRPAASAALHVPIDVSLDVHEADRCRVTLRWRGRETSATRPIPITADDVRAAIAVCGQPTAHEHLSVLQSVGRKLFVLLADDIPGDAYSAALAEANRSGAKVAIRLHLANAGHLARAPWELLHDGKDFLVLQSIAIARSLDGTSDARATADEALRLLVTISSPNDQHALDVEREASLLRDAMGGLELIGRASIDVAADGALDTLRRMLRAAAEAGRPYNAWHFIGHGRFNAASGQSELAMTGEGGAAQFVGESVLRVLFREHPLRVAVLNACETAHRPPIGFGAKAVVAMQFRISDAAAIVLADEVYSGIATGAGLVHAISDVRLTLFCRPGAEWITPILFLEDEAREPGLLS
ncbi:MAG TPA: CHAT domain-containing protein, partial [Thermoanaerobaculia bacterium]